MGLPPSLASNNRQSHSNQEEEEEEEGNIPFFPCRMYNRWV